MGSAHVPAALQGLIWSYSLLFIKQQDIEQLPTRQHG
jgi:hypothetical protein